MGRTRWQLLLLLAVAGTAVVLAVLRVAESRGATVLPVPLLAGAVLVLLAAVVLRLGWAVRRHRDDRRRRMDPILAARTVVLAKASAYTGALLTGWYGGHVLLVLPDLHIDARRDVAVSGVVVGLCAVALGVAGLVVERWCEVRDDDEDPGADPGTAPEASV